MELGKVNTTISTLYLIASKLGVDVTELVKPNSDRVYSLVQRFDILFSVGLSLGKLLSIGAYIRFTQQTKVVIGLEFQIN